MIELSRVNDFGSSLFDSSHLLTIQEVSKYLSVPVSTIRSWMYKGNIPYVKFGDGKRSHVRFNPKIILEWIDMIQKEPKLKIKENTSYSCTNSVKTACKKTVNEFNSFIKGLREA